MPQHHGAVPVASPQMDASLLESQIRSEREFWSNTIMDEVRVLETETLKRFQSLEENLTSHRADLKAIEERHRTLLTGMGDATMAELAKMRSELAEEVQAMRYECLPQSGHLIGNVQAVALSEPTVEFKKEIATIREAMSTRASASDRKVNELTELTREIATELAILRGRLQAIGERPDLVSQIVASCPAADDDKEERLGRRLSRGSVSSDSDISALRPRSVSAERPQTTFRQFTSDSAHLLRSVESGAAYPNGGGSRAGDSLTGAIGAQCAGARDDDPLLRPRQSAATGVPRGSGLLDVIAEARPSMERPSTQGPTSARPSMD